MLNSIEQLKHNDKIKTDILTALTNMLVQEAFVKLIEPIHNAICVEAMSKFKPVYVLEGYTESEKVGDRMTVFDHLYMASDEISKTIFDWIKSELSKKGFVAEGVFCPYLQSNTALFNCQTQLINVMAVYTGIDNSKLKIVKYRSQYIDKITTLLVSLAKDTGTELNIFKKPQDAKTFLASM